MRLPIAKSLLQRRDLSHGINIVLKALIIKTPDALQLKFEKYFKQENSK